MRNLTNINPDEIARVSTKRLNEIVRKTEALVSIQLENIRALDSRATQIMTSLGLILSIMIGVLALNDETLTKFGFAVFFIFLAFAALSTIMCLASCLKIIQSDDIFPLGNDGLELLGDVSDKYSEHEEALDYILVLSTSRYRNEKLIKRNGRLLKSASRFFFLSVLLVLISGSLLALKPDALFILEAVSKLLDKAS